MNEFAAQRLSRRSFAAVAGTGAVAFASMQQAGAQEGSGPGGNLPASQGLTVSGNGRATGEVDSGVMQLLVRYGGTAPQMKGGADYSMGMNVPTPDEDALTPIVNALIEGGIEADAILISVGSGSMYGMFGVGVSIVGAGLNVEQIGNLATISELVSAAALEADLAIDQFGVAYSTADCQGVSDAAYQTAADDARLQAEALARVLGIELGQIVGVNASAPWSAYARYDGTGTGCQAIFEPEDALTNYLPAWMPGVEPAFALTVMISLTFAIVTES